MKPAPCLALCLLLLTGCMAPVDSVDSELDGLDSDAEELALEGTSQALTSQWVTSGALTDTNPTARGFGRGVSVAADRVAVTGPMTTQVFARANGAWYRQFLYTTASDHYPVAFISNTRLFVAERCLSGTNGCRGRLFSWAFRNNSWVPAGAITTTTLPDHFGRELSFDGTNLYVSDTFSVYHYVVSDPDSIRFVRRYTAPSTLYGHMSFGYTLASADGYLAVGAPSGLRSGGGNSPGYVYIYRNGWLMQTLTGVGLEHSNWGWSFGNKVSMSGTRLAVSAPAESGRFRTVYLYRRDANGTYLLESTLPQPDTYERKTQVAISGSLIAVTTSAPQGTGASVLRLFEIGRFGPTLTAEYPLSSVDWDPPVAIQGSRAVVGQRYSNADRGSALTFYNQPLVLDQINLLAQ